MAIVAIVLAGSLALYSVFGWIYGWFGGAPSFIAFTFHRSEPYYSHFADGCDELMAKYGTNRYLLRSGDPRLPYIFRDRKQEGWDTNVFEMTGDDPRLPAEIRKISPAIIDISTNRVWMFIDVTAPYSIEWETDYINPKAMVLSSDGEGNVQKLFFRTNSAPSAPASAY